MVSNRISHHEFQYDTFSRKLVERFHHAGSVCKGKSPRERSILEKSPTKSVIVLKQVITFLTLLLELLTIADISFTFVS